MPRLKAQQSVPDFHLPATSGTEISASQFRQRNNLVLYFFGKVPCEPCRQRLASFRDNFSNFEHLNARLFAISPKPLELLKSLKQELKLPFELLSDRQLEAANLYTQIKPRLHEPYPSIFVIDRYNTLYAQAIEEKEENLPPIKDIFRVLHSIEIECPECGFFPGSTSI